MVGISGVLPLYLDVFNGLMGQRGASTSALGGSCANLVRHVVGNISHQVSGDPEGLSWKLQPREENQRNPLEK